MHISLYTSIALILTLQSSITDDLMSHIDSEMASECSGWLQICPGVLEVEQQILMDLRGADVKTRVRTDK